MTESQLGKLASTLGLPVERLLGHLNEIGITIGSGSELVTGAQQLNLLQHLRSKESAPSQTMEFTISEVKAATDLRELNQLLTDAMTARKIQALIKDSNLDLVIEAVLALVVDRDQQLLAAAVLGRLAAVARGRESCVFSSADEVLTTEPASIETLDDADEKTYATSMLAYCSASWVSRYTYREAVNIDTADTARRELLSANLTREDSISVWIKGISEHAVALKDVNSEDARLRRVRRIFASMRDVCKQWRRDVGMDVGDCLAECLRAFLSSKPVDIDPEIFCELMDNILSVLCRVIEIRFSMALYASTYALIPQGKKMMGPGAWGRFIDRSKVMPDVRSALLESALVLARQNRSDRQIMEALSASYSSRAQVAAAVKRRFRDARDLDPDIANWWCSAGRVSERQRTVEQKVGNTEDSQIGALLIEIESFRESMEKVGRAVVPLLEISEPILASTARKAVAGFKSIEQTTLRLCRMRKLTRMELTGERLEYNPLEHELLGGHRPGVRRVHVIRDGIKKEFSGKVKTLVKPWVEAEEKEG